MTIIFTLYERQRATSGPAVVTVSSTTVTEHNVHPSTLLIVLPIGSLLIPNCARCESFDSPMEPKIQLTAPVLYINVPAIVLSCSS
jgi:hypothetical protein